MPLVQAADAVEMLRAMLVAEREAHRTVCLTLKETDKAMREERAMPPSLPELCSPHTQTGHRERDTTTICIQRVRDSELPLDLFFKIKGYA